MNTFNRLLTLYNRSEYDRTPLEDYCTECLAGVLESDQELLNAFVREVLKIPSEERFRLQTQKSYILEDGLNRIDLVFESDSWLSFLEMKVHSSEGEDQLMRYRDYLTNKRIHQGKQTALRYCTLYIENKEDLNDIEQLRWKDVAGFLREKVENNLLINEFYQFLTEMKMAGNERFTYQDLIGLQVYGKLTAKVREVFQLIQDELESHFGKSSRGVGTTSEIFRHNRLGLMCENVIGEGWSEVLVAFRFNRSKGTGGPAVVVQLWIKKDNSSFNDFRTAVLELDEYSFMDDIEGNGGAVRFEKPLAEFIEHENQIGEITGWITDKLGLLSQLKQQTSDLNWSEIRNK